MLRDIEADHLPAVVSQDEHHEAESESRRRHMKISIAAMPSASLLRKLRQVGDGVRGRQHVFGNRRVTDLDTEL